MTDHFAKTKGYESYQYLTKAHSKGMSKLAEAFVGIQPWETPEQILEKLMKIRKQIGFNVFAPTFWYGGMPIDVKERSLNSSRAKSFQRFESFPTSEQREFKIP